MQVEVDENDLPIRKSCNSLPRPSGGREDVGKKRIETVEMI